MGLTIAGILAVVTSVRPWSLLPILPLTGVLIVLRRFYMGSSRDIKRLEGVSKSPVFSQLSTSLQGLTTIRAFKAEQMLQEEFDHLQDVHTSTWFAFISTTRWFGLWLDWIVTVYMACVVYSFLLLSTDLLDGEVGLAISSCMMLEEVQWMVRQTAEGENLMPCPPSQVSCDPVSVCHVFAYSCPAPPPRSVVPPCQFVTFLLIPALTPLPRPKLL